MSDLWKYIVTLATMVVIVVTLVSVAITITDKLSTPSKAECLYSGGVWMDGARDYCATVSDKLAK